MELAYLKKVEDVQERLWERLEQWRLIIVRNRGLDTEEIMSITQEPSFLKTPPSFDPIWSLQFPDNLYERPSLLKDSKYCIASLQKLKVVKTPLWTRFDVQSTSNKKTLLPKICSPKLK